MRIGDAAADQGGADSLRVGGDADIVVFDGNPVENMQARCVMTMIEGAVVYDTMSGNG